MYARDCFVTLLILRTYEPGRVFTLRMINPIQPEQDAGFNNILLVGHNPGLTDFANYLVPDLTDNIPTCGYLSVKFELDNWNLKDAESVELVIYDYPKRQAS